MASGKDVVGSVLIAGGGIVGMQAALDLADSGFYVHLVERSPGIGGVIEKEYHSQDNRRRRKGPAWRQHRRGGDGSCPRRIHRPGS